MTSTTSDAIFTRGWISFCQDTGCAVDLHHFFALFSALVSEVKTIAAAVICRFFQIAPAGQDHFKQSTTRLYFIADKIIEMTMEMYQQPRMMVEAGQFVFSFGGVSDIWSNDSFSAFPLPTKHTHTHSTNTSNSRTFQPWASDMLAMPSPQSCLLHLYLPRWKLCERELRMISLRVRFGGH